MKTACLSGFNRQKAHDSALFKYSNPNGALCFLSILRYNITKAKMRNAAWNLARLKNGIGFSG